MIARTRKHARVKSVAWKTFTWLVVHEAAVNVLVNCYAAKDHYPLRSWVAHQSTSGIRRRIERVLREDRGRRFWP
jgi:hypothetical protein